MSDIFQEVDEEVRREQLTKLWQRYGNYIVALCIIVVAGVGAWRGYQWWEAKQAAQAGAAFEQAATLAEAGKHQEAEAAFAKLAIDGTAGYRVLARLRQAARACAEPTAKLLSPPMMRSPPTRVPDRSSRIWRRYAPVSCSSTPRHTPNFGRGSSR